MVRRELLIATSTFFTCGILLQTEAQYSAAGNTRACVDTRSVLAEDTMLYQQDDSDSDSEIFIRHLNHTIQQNVINNNLYIKGKPETLCAMESYLPNSDRHAASWIFSDGPRQQLGVVKLRYNALKLFFYNVAILRQRPFPPDLGSFPSFVDVYVARNNHPF